MLTKKINLVAIIIGIALTALFISFMGTEKVFGNQSGIAPGAKSAVATTTVNFMTPGTATTTVVYDSYNQNGTNQPVGYVPTTSDGATLLVQQTASSTTSILGWKYEYSQDGLDWYGDAIVNYGNATTTQVQSLAVNNSYTWNFASSTSCDNTAVLLTNNRGCKAVNVQTPTRYVRAVFFIPTGASNAGVYAQFVPRKQNP